MLSVKLNIINILFVFVAIFCKFGVTNNFFMRIFTIIGLVLASATSSFAQDFFLGTSKDKVTEYYIISVSANRKTHVMEAFDRIKPAAGQLATFRQQVIEARQKDKLSTDGFEKLGYYRRKIQYSCKDRKYRQMECIYYDMAGKVIEETEPDEKLLWDAVPAGSIRDIEFKKVCSVAK